MSDSAYAPFNVSYGEYQPYLTVTEYQNAPTAVDTSNLLANASATQQSAALAEVIARASSLIDQECLGAWGTLNATVNVENARIWGNNRGELIVHPKFWPVLEVQAFSYGTTPATSASVTPAGNIWVEPSGFVVAPTGIAGLGLNALAGVAPRQEYYCTWTYVNGWPNTTLAASVQAGAASITPVSVTGIYPGSQLTLFDAPDDEQVTVAPTYVPGASVVPLTAGVANNHPAGAVITNLPKAAKQAAIALTTCLIKVRGSGALIVDDIGAVEHVAAGNPQGAAGDLEMALWSIRSLRNLWGGY